ncbi:hypothetical protein ACIA3K_20855 [Micromonospora sp. NPDC051543]|uniref:hypothetical protein n=1 Tax=Micromonospora sp. NPDC051543 TaxID=3364287 RepID=UPI00379B81A2
MRALDHCAAVLLDNPFLDPSGRPRAGHLAGGDRGEPAAARAAVAEAWEIRTLQGVSHWSERRQDAAQRSAESIDLT